MRCPICNSPDLKVAGGKTSCRTCLREFEATNPVDGSAPFDSPSAIADPATVPDFPLTPPGGSAYLVQCHMCGHQVSPEAFSCPACGQPLRAGSEMTTMKVLRIIFWVIIGIVVGGILLGAIFNNIADAYIHSK
jgi:hypothetical protein